MKRNDRIFDITMTIFFLLVTIYISILIAPAFENGKEHLIDGLNKALQNPLELKLSSKTGTVFCVIMVGEVLAYLSYYATKTNTRNGEEHGSAKWINCKQVCKIISDKDYFKNRILTSNMRISVIGKKIKLSLNTLVVGGMGSGKSFFILIPNLLQANTSFMVADPSKELLKATGWFLKYVKKYNVKVLDLEEPSKSMKYNFFKYILHEDDILRTVDIIFEATIKGNKNGSQDPMWENMAKDYLLALIGLLWYRGTSNEQNIETLLWLLNEDKMEEDENGNRIKTSVMALFDDLENRMPGNMATMAYKSATDGAVATIKGVKSTIRGRLGKFILPSIQMLMSDDEMELEKLGLEKTALFLVVPSEDTSFNFIVSLLYGQAIPILYNTARKQPDNKLPVPMQLFMDEMTNFCMPKDYITYLTTGRKHEISFCMFIQEIAQLEKMFPEKQFRTLIGTCNTFVYLGGSGSNTNEFISKWTGNETISVYDYSKSYGRNGSYTKAEHKTKRALLNPDEIDTKMGDDNALVYVKGKGFAYDMKNDPRKHPNYKYVYASNGGKIYDYTGEGIANTILKPMRSISSIEAASAIELNIDEISIEELSKVITIIE